jgi:TatD DNase family protein
MIDSHCHLADKAFDPDRHDVIVRAIQAKIQMMVCIADSLSEAKKCIELSRLYDALYATVGVHPHNAKEWTHESEETLQSLIASSDKVRAVGEIGLDYHYDFSPQETQREVFRRQLEIAKELDHPAIVHCREAVEDVWTIVQEINPPSLVLHCCTEQWEDVERFVSKGYFLSFTGMVTYTNALEIRRTVELCPLEQIMIETDAPYLAPVPYRGKRNEPAFVIEVAKAIAEIKKLPLEKIASTTEKNTIQFFL